MMKSSSPAVVFSLSLPYTTLRTPGKERESIEVVFLSYPSAQTVVIEGAAMSQDREVGVGLLRSTLEPRCSSLQLGLGSGEPDAASPEDQGAMSPTDLTSAADLAMPTSAVDLAMPTSPFDPRGGPVTGLEVKFPCPANQFVIGFRGTMGQYIDQFGVGCAPLVVYSDLTVAVGAVTELPPYGGNGGGPFPPTNCPPGQVATVTRQRAQPTQPVDAFGLGCSKPYVH